MSVQPQSPTGPAEVRPYSQASRAGYGLLWTAWTVVLLVGGFALLAHGTVLGGLLGLALGALALRYAWKIWTWQAKRLIFFIVF